MPGSGFSKPSRKATDDPSPKRAEPPGLDAFAARASNVHIVRAPSESEEDLAQREVHGMSIRFTEEEKQAIKKLAKAETRSQHRVVKMIIGPALIAAAAKLGES